MLPEGEQTRLPSLPISGVPPPTPWLGFPHPTPPAATQCVAVGEVGREPRPLGQKDPRYWRNHQPEILTMWARLAATAITRRNERRQKVV